MPWKMCKALAGAGALALLLSSASAMAQQKLTIATVNNADMIIMQRLSKDFEKSSGIALNWVVLEENVLRQRVTTDIATNGGQFDVLTIGTYEVPIWGSAGLAAAGRRRARRLRPERRAEAGARRAFA